MLWIGADGDTVGKKPGTKQIPFKNVVYEYPLSKAIEDGYTRTPYAITRSDIDFFHFGNEALDKLMLQDGIVQHEKRSEVWKNMLYLIIKKK